MTFDRWERIRELFEAALDCQGADRSVFLDRACQGDEDMRSELERLLAANDQAGSFLEHRPFDSEQILERADTDLIGQRMGRYSIQALIGKGGMGAVYRAVREDDFRMEVAIKLLKRGTDTEAALARFRFERQVLAGLQHPNIARLLDGGATADGLPYLVMEYVDGTPLLKYATPLPLRERLELFRSVCSAVQCAHDKKVVHRDIKPANILVTSAGVPKLLDFGIAKLLDPEADGAVTLTSTGARLMTPNYASPEQVRGDPLTPATDIYSLGLVLFELVTGRQAHDVNTGSKEPIDQIICTRDAKRPSAVAKNIPHDLDNIVLKALRKEPERRYASAADLSEDLDRFLHDLPVRARKESVVYSTLKFIKRKRALITAVAVTAVLAASSVISLGRIGASRRAGQTAAAQKDLRWTFKKLAALGEPAPGGGVYTKYFQPWRLNNRGDVTFVSEVAAGGGEAVFLLKKGASSAIPLARPGQAAPGGGVFAGASKGYTFINDAGDVAFSCGLEPFTPPELKAYEKAGLYFYSHTDQRLSAVVVPGVTSAPGFGVFQTTGDGAIMNSSGEIVFPGIVQTKAGVHPETGLGQGIFLVGRNGQITKVVAPGDPAPGGSTFDDTFNPWINDQGDIAFEARVAGEECITSGCWATGVYVKPAGAASLETVARKGGGAPDGARYYSVWGPILNNRSDVVFIGSYHTPNPGNSIYLYSRGATAFIAGSTSMLMPDGRKIVYVNPWGVGNISFNNRGDISFFTPLEKGESALYVHSQGAIHLAAGTGTVIPGVGTVASVNNFRNGGTLNDSGQIFFWVMTKDGKGVLLLATPLSIPNNVKL